MKIKTAIILTIITFLIITSTSLFVLDHTIAKEVTPIMYDFHVNRDTSGFHAAPDALHFGTIIEGNSNSKRTFTVSNNESFNKKIEIFIAPLIPKEPLPSCPPVEFQVAPF